MHLFSSCEASGVSDLHVWYKQTGIRESKQMLNSIRYRIVLVYVLLIFIAMTLLGVFIVNQLEGYYLDTVSKNLDKFVNNGTLLQELNKIEDIGNHQPEIQSSIEQWGRGIQEDIFVVDKNAIILASKTGNQIGRVAVDVLDASVIARGLQGEESENDGYIGDIPVKNKVYPIVHNDKVTGILYLRANMSSIFETVNRTKTIYIQAMAIAIIVTALLGFVIAGSITTPINHLRKKAEDMARGDFSHMAEVKSDDEIGRLTEMFNQMQMRLGLSMSEMLNEKNKLETILKYMDDGLIAVDMQGNIIHANQAAIKMFTLDETKLGFMSYYNIIMEKIYPELTVYSIKQKSNEMEGELVFERGASIFYIRYGKFEDEKNRDVGIILVIQDITQRQKLEKMQTDFVANVSHELKTPLTTIKSYIETILENMFDGDRITDGSTVKNFLTVVDKEADRMSRLVKDLLQLSRLDYNKEILSKGKWNIAMLVGDAVRQIEINALNKEQHLNVIFDRQKTLYVDVDKDRIEQVLINILSNAIKYTVEKGRIDVDIQENDDEINVSVTDNGIGIPREDIPRLFERFYRVDKARSRQMGGTGLGLAIAKQIVEAHGGFIAVESKEGKGTRVTVSLPKGSAENEE